MWSSTIWVFEYHSWHEFVYRKIRTSNRLWHQVWQLLSIVTIREIQMPQLPGFIFVWKLLHKWNNAHKPCEYTQDDWAKVKNMSLSVLHLLDSCLLLVVLFVFRHYSHCQLNIVFEKLFIEGALVHRVKSVPIWSFSGPYFPAFGVNSPNAGKYGAEKLRIQTRFSHWWFPFSMQVLQDLSQTVLVAN